MPDVLPETDIADVVEGGGAHFGPKLVVNEIFGPT